MRACVRVILLVDSLSKWPPLHGLVRRRFSKLVMSTTAALGSNPGPTGYDT